MNLTDQQLEAVILATSRGLARLHRERSRALLDSCLLHAEDDAPQPWMARADQIVTDCTTALVEMRAERERRRKAASSGAASSARPDPMPPAVLGRICADPPLKLHPPR